jgi:SAM-dependent methyltransferase
VTDVAAAYAARAAEYVEVVGSMTAVHPSDRHLVETWAAAASGPILDAGCGPGHWTHHLHQRGVDIRGFDLVPAFIDGARTTYPGVRFELGSIDAIDETDGAVGGILSWFSTIHHEPERIAVPLSEFARVLRPGGTLLLGSFDSEQIEPFDHAVTRAYRWPASQLQSQLEEAGFDVIETHRRSERGRRPVGAVLCERRS